MTRVLLVDDDDDFRMPLRKYLERTGHEVIEARNGTQAVEAYKKQPVDVVVTDLIMPEKEGIETIMELKRQHPQVRIVAMSGGGRINGGDFLKVAQQLGARRALAKPFSCQAMVAAIAEVMGGEAG
jgi:DNA-binding NtrC family response regulator